MDYGTLFEAWIREKENDELQPLDEKFYIDLSEYIRAQREEYEMLDDESLRARFMAEASARVESLFKDLLYMRCRKMYEAVFEGTSLMIDRFTPEEVVISRDLSSALEKVESMERSVLRGQVLRLTERDLNQPMVMLIRFLQAIPTIVGPNAKIYGPFKVEDVASLPVENAESLIKRGVAVKVEIE